MPSHISNSCITITCSSESQASWQRSPTETINYGDRTCGVARGTCETLDAARNDVTHPKHGRRLSCIPSRTSGLEEKAQRGPGRLFLTKTKAGGIWAYCDGIKHADAHTPQVGSTHPADTQPWKSCGHLRLIVAKFVLLGKATGDGRLETPYHCYSMS